jgi:hypothetical protein
LLIAGLLGLLLGAFTYQLARPYNLPIGLLFTGMGVLRMPRRVCGVGRLIDSR